MITINILETMYYGNLNPSARSVVPNSRAERLNRYIAETIAGISSVLSERDRDTFNQLLDAQSELASLDSLSCFQIGFRYGAQMILAATCTPSKENYSAMTE